MDWQLTTLIALATALFVGGVTKGAVGFGTALVSLPLVTSFIDVRAALALMTMPVLASNLWQAFQGRMAREVLSRFWWILVAMAVGCAIGALLASSLHPRYVFLFMGSIIIVFVTTNIWTPALPMPATDARALGLVAGFASGVIGGISTIFGPPIIMYLVMRRVPHELFFATIGVISLFSGVLLVTSYVSVGMLSGPLILLSLASVLPVLAGMALGQWLRRRVNADVFRRLVLLMLLALGLNLLRRAVF